MGKLDGKVVFVTGGARGIGACITRLFAKEGASILFADLLENESNELASELRGRGNKVAFDLGDASVGSDVKRAVARAVEMYGHLDLVIAVAGWMRHPATTAVETDEEDFDRTFDVNAKGVWLAAKFSIPHLLAAGGGAIVNIASVYGHRGIPGRLAYGGSKAAVSEMTRVLAVEYGPSNIRVNAISPGPIATEKLLRTHHSGGGESSVQVRESCFPTRRLGRPEDVAAAALFLASDDASWINGHDLVVDGGLSIQSPESLVFQPFRELWHRASPSA